MKQSLKVDRLLVSAIVILSSTLPYTRKAEATPAIGAPLGACIVNPYCAIAVVTIGGIAY